MGFTQRQAAGKFARDEAAAFISQLQDTDSDGSIAIVVAAPAWRQSAQEQMLSCMPSEQLAGVTAPRLCGSSAWRITPGVNLEALCRRLCILRSR
jgi:hypothetical protein